MIATVKSMDLWGATPAMIYEAETKYDDTTIVVVVSLKYFRNEFMGT